MTTEIQYWLFNTIQAIIFLKHFFHLFCGFNCQENKSYIFLNDKNYRNPSKLFQY